MWTIPPAVGTRLTSGIEDMLTFTNIFSRRYIKLMSQVYKDHGQREAFLVTPGSTYWAVEVESRVSERRGDVPRMPHRARSHYPVSNMGHDQCYAKKFEPFQPVRYYLRIT